MATVLQMNTKLALVGIFDQIMGEDESIREKGLEYISGPFLNMQQKLFHQHPDAEACLFKLVKKVCTSDTLSQHPGAEACFLYVHTIYIQSSQILKAGIFYFSEFSKRSQIAN